MTIFKLLGKFLINQCSYLLNDIYCFSSMKYCQRVKSTEWWHILCQSLFFKKVANPRSATLLKKRLWRRCFPVNFTKFSRTPIFKSNSGWLLLKLKDVKLYVTISTHQYLNRVYYDRKRLFQVWTSVFTHWPKKQFCWIVHIIYQSNS